MGSMILIGLGLLIGVAFVVAANNILHRYWKDLGWTWFKAYDTRYQFIDEPVKEEPKLNKPEEPKK